jgi:hypothetical protein
VSTPTAAPQAADGAINDFETLTTKDFNQDPASYPDPKF